MSKGKEPRENRSAEKNKSDEQGDVATKQQSKGIDYGNTAEPDKSISQVKIVEPRDMSEEIMRNRHRVKAATPQRKVVEQAHKQHNKRVDQEGNMTFASIWTKVKDTLGVDGIIAIITGVMILIFTILFWYLLPTHKP